MAENLLKISAADGNETVSDDIQITYALLHTAQQTLCDLDKSVGELALLVEGLKKQSEKLSGKAV